MKPRLTFVALTDFYAPPADVDELEEKAHRPATAAARRTLTGLEFLDESRQENLLGEKGAHPCGCLAGDDDGRAPQPLNLLDHRVNLAMSHRSARIFLADRIQQFRHMTRSWPDIQDWRCDAKNIVNLTRMHQAHEGIAHHHHMEVRR